MLGGARITRFAVLDVEIDDSRTCQKLQNVRYIFPARRTSLSFRKTPFSGSKTQNEGFLGVRARSRLTTRGTDLRSQNRPFSRFGGRKHRFGEVSETAECALYLPRKAHLPQIPENPCFCDFDPPKREIWVLRAQTRNLTGDDDTTLECRFGPPKPLWVIGMTYVRDLAEMSTTNATQAASVSTEISTKLRSLHPRQHMKTCRPRRWHLSS